MDRLTVWCSYCVTFLPEGVRRYEHLEDEHPLEAERERQDRRERAQRRVERRSLNSAPVRERLDVRNS